jgi:hypothetical protein
MDHVGSLWTPDGERPVDTSRPGPSADADSGGAPAPSDAEEAALAMAAQAIGLDLSTMSPEEREQLRAELAEMTRVRAQVAATPVSEVLTSHLMRFFDLALIYLDATPPKFHEAAVVIEAFRSVIDSAGDELGEHEQMLRDTLGQAQMVFVQVKESLDAVAGPDGAG